MAALKGATTPTAAELPLPVLLPAPELCEAGAEEPAEPDCLGPLAAAEPLECEVAVTETPGREADPEPVTAMEELEKETGSLSALLEAVISTEAADEEKVGSSAGRCA